MAPFVCIYHGLFRNYLLQPYVSLLEYHRKFIGVVVLTVDEAANENFIMSVYIILSYTTHCPW